MAQLKDSSVTGGLQISGGMAVANRIKANQFIELSDADADLLNNDDVNTAIGRDLANGVSGIDANRDLTWNTDNLSAFTRVDNTTFTIGTTDVTSYYEAGRMLRFNGSVCVPILSSTYANSVTTVVIRNGYTLPATVTSIERSKVSSNAIFNDSSIVITTASTLDPNDYNEGQLIIKVM